ncbi:MAG TPA: SDR family oxidoreductase [Solirubrobacteraceae bacterium]|jgi:NAD(P)-dependent dehydrogenase (short-subunit alcohol dehydrogenase family)|nr:SDR family oxidoreductase [Solirubrobacteraceae bacterium]
MLRPGLLEGIAVLLAGPAPDARREALADAVAGACSALGATLARCSAPAARAPNPDREPAHTNVRSSPEEGEAAGERAVRIALEELGRIDLLVVDAATATTPAEADALGECLRSAWTLTRSVFNLAFLPAQSGRLVYVAPREGSYPYAGAARAGLENLARTLSIEWARHGVTAVTIAPGRLTPAGEVAALAAYLASPAGAYFSGCVLDLRGGGSSAAHPAE